ncbi:MAG: HAD family phosphatase [Oscillospiraceae bacterium]|nr:HAD family phosphatase [Oscillospiraceae bacterium]
MYHVIFDMDGVLFDSERTLLNCWLEVAARHGLDEALMTDTYIRTIGTNAAQTREIYTRAFLGVLGEERLWQPWDESLALHAERYADGLLPLKAGVRELLAYLKARGVAVGIASSSAKQTVEERIRAAGLSDFFIGCVGGDAVRISKPDPEIYLLACAAFGFAPGDTFAIEDSYNGIRAASAAGMRPIMVPDIVPADVEMERLSETVCRDLFDVMEYLKNAADPPRRTGAD